MLADAIEPAVVPLPMDKVPPLMVVAPVYVLVLVSVSVPLPALVRATVPLPFWMTPLKVVFVLPT